MNKKNFKVGDEVFYIGHVLKRGKIIKILDYGYTVQTKHGEDFFNDISTYTKQEAYNECMDNVEYWNREADRLLNELEDEEEESDDAPYLESWERSVAG